MAYFMKRIFHLIVLAAFLSSAIAGCALDDFFSPNYGDKEYPTTSLPGPAPKRQQQQPVSDQKQRLTAPDEEASLGPTPKSATQTVRDESLDGSPAVKSGSGSMVRVKTTSHITFTGAVTAIDTVGKTISVKTAGKNMTFDLKNPVVRGYPNAGEIKIGDIITLGYIRNGIGIVKGENFHEDLKEQTAADELVPLKNNKQSKRQAAAKQRSNRAAPTRVKYKVNTMTFKDIDNNKDGRISPVELCTVVPSLTMIDFKAYDRNGDGCLDENEYRTVRKR